MRTLIFLCAVLFSLKSVSQTKTNGIQYIGSRALTGSSEAVIVENVPLVHTKQFLATNKKGKIVGKNNIKVQIDQVFKNISNSLLKTGSGIDRIIKLNIYLTETELIPEVQALISPKFDPVKQPSITIAAGELTHQDALVSIDVVAVSTLMGDNIKYLDLNVNQEASSAILPAGPVVYISGQAAKGELAEATHGTLKQLDETLKGLGLSMKDVVQIKSFLTPMSSISIVRKQFADFFKGETIPPLVFVEWVSKDPVIEIELISTSHARSAKVEQVEYITPKGMTASPVYAKVSRLNYGKKVYLSGIYGVKSGSVDSEVDNLFSLMKGVLARSGSSFDYLLKATYYIDDDDYSKSLGDIRRRYYDPMRPPAASKAIIREVGFNKKGISIDMIGTIRE